MRTDARYPNYPAVLFRKIKGSSIPLLINLQGTYERLALAIDSNLQGMVEEFGRRENAPVPVKRVDRAQAPVKEVVWKGADADVTKLPMLPAIKSSIRVNTSPRRSLFCAIRKPACRMPAFIVPCSTVSTRLVL